MGALWESSRPTTYIYIYIYIHGESTLPTTCIYKSYISIYQGKRSSTMCAWPTPLGLGGSEQVCMCTHSRLTSLYACTHARTHVLLCCMLACLYACMLLHCNVFFSVCVCASRMSQDPIRKPAAIHPPKHPPALLFYPTYYPTAIAIQDVENTCCR